MIDLKLIEKAEFEESNYNWKAAAEIYKKIADNYFKTKNKIKAADIYKKLGHIYSLCVDSSDTSQEYIKYNELRINAYGKAVEIYRKLNYNPGSLECEAEQLLAQGHISKSFEKAREYYSLSHQKFLKSNNAYEKINDTESIVRTICSSLKPLSYMVWFFVKQAEIDEIYEISYQTIKKFESVYKNGKIKYYRERVDILSGGGTINLAHLFVIPFTQGIWRERAKENLKNIEDVIDYYEDCEDKRLLGIIFSYCGLSYLHYGFHYSENNIEQNEFMNRGLKLAEQGELLLREVKEKTFLIYNLVWTLYHALLFRQFDYVQKRIVKVINDVLSLVKIYEGIHSFYNFFGNILPANYYANNAQRTFFKPNQRISFAHKGIDYANRCLESLPLGPFSSWTYQHLTWTYSLLVNIEYDEKKRKEYAELMLKNAKIAESICISFKGGYVYAAGYSSIYRANKTLADMTKDEKEKIRYLKAAVSAQKQYIHYAFESRTGIISAQLRLGLLMEELARVSKNQDTFKNTVELFQEVINLSKEKGYLSYSGAAHEYIARIEDRLGNFRLSSKNYENAKEDYENSLELISYKLLKKKIIDKIEYLLSWSIIERAKAYHKNEDHLTAKRCYLKASEILENLKQFKYEASYYRAWSSLEEAESYSKLEKHKEAIRSYYLTISSFKASISTLDAILIKIKDNIEKLRIVKLKAVAKLRVKYCLARIELEEARVLERSSKNVLAAEKFASAAQQFDQICKAFRNERERKELEAIFYLCKAWENMELADNYQDPNKFYNAAILFNRASELYSESKFKLLALGNSNICSALEKGCNFDQTHELKIKAKLYSQIKSMLRSATDSYRKGGFVKAADWAFATSSYFDAVWNLIQAEMQTNLNEKKILLNLGANLLSSTAELFGKSGYKNKEKEVLDRLDMISKEARIIISALNTIKEPEISKSTTGIIAPACPLETSQSPKISEVREYGEATQIDKTTHPKEKYKIVYKDLLKDTSKIEQPEFRVGVAQIGISNTGDIMKEFYEEKASGLIGLRADKIDDVINKTREVIEQASDIGVNILVFPEMSIDLNYTSILEQISDLAEKYRMYIIPGSYHDERTKRNVCMVIGPDGIHWEQEKHIPAMIHFGEERFKEGIKVSKYPRTTYVCNTEFGRIAILICRDFLDMDLRVELKNFEPPVDLIFNPAFTPVTADFKAAHFDARRSLYAYCFFSNIGEFGDSFIYTPEKERTERNIAPKEKGLIYKDVDLFKLRSERKKWEKIKEKERKFIQSTRS